MAALAADLGALRTSTMNPRAFELADHLVERRRFSEAFRVLLTAARSGDNSVFINLGYAYDVGRGIRQSKRKALH
jgi:TPR repeat protein